MSYQVLARKWRPKSFRELIGQEHVVQALTHALEQQRLHHAYLFTGTRGVGKTTLARILVKCLNCEQGISATPCGVCSACVEIDQGRFIDLIEVDAASRTKVEDTRELLDNVQYKPTRGRYKIYLIDEVHMLSTHSFNALLKTLEEPPPHVKFLLATTDPQKLPITVLSRCLQFSLKSVAAPKLVTYLGDVLKQENISFEEPALWALARAGEGSVRDTLSLTDQAIAFGNGQLIAEEVDSLLGTVDRGRLLKLCTSLAEHNLEQGLQLINEWHEQSISFSRLLADLASIFHRVAIAQAAPDAIDNSLGDKDAILMLAKQISAEDIQVFYEIALIGRRDLSLSPDPKMAMEMVLLRLHLFNPQSETAVALSQPLVEAPVAQPQPLSAPAIQQVEQKKVTLSSPQNIPTQTRIAERAEQWEKFAEQAQQDEAVQQLKEAFSAKVVSVKPNN